MTTERCGYPVVSKEQARFIEELRNSSSERLKDIQLNGALLPDGSRSRFGRLSGKWKYRLDAPFKISAKCRDVIKKHPLINYERRAGRAMMTGESASERLTQGKRRLPILLKLFRLEDLKLNTQYATKMTHTIDEVTCQYGLTSSERKVFVTLLYSADGKMECSLTVGEIAEMCGISRSAVRRAIRAMEEKGLVTREAQYYEDEPTARAANKYTLRFGA